MLFHPLHNIDASSFIPSCLEVIHATGESDSHMNELLQPYNRVLHFP